MSNHWSGKNFNRFVSSWSTVMKRIPKGLELGSVLLNIYVNNLIIFLDFNSCNYADGTATRSIRAPFQYCLKIVFRSLYVN